MATKISQTEFIAKALAAHGNKYDYSQAIYINSKTKVKIICPEHGLFEQTAGRHSTSRQGCPKCWQAPLSASRVLSLEQFIIQARTVHSDKYNYSQSLYVGNKTKISILCPLHGVFKQSPSSHLKGHGCTLCGIRTNQKLNSFTTNTFIKKARAVHNSKYDYSNVTYINNYTHINLICPIHGQFKQSPAQHLKSGCIKCGYDSLSRIRTLTTTEFIAQARAIHGDKYDYSQAVYIGGKFNLTIICPLHGPFQQRPNHHTAGAGCQACSNNAAKLSWVERANGRVCTLYFLRIFNLQESFYKIGVTYHSVRRRYSGEADMQGYNYEILALYKSINAAAILAWEQSILDTFISLRYWPKIRFAGETECFSSADEILSIFPR